ncbi:hypothetical protein [Atopococcus tabaci]|uniref:hypothetical protein n=1 Tax=Atopococcus tabaci TaxID=269774 RepID=UPI00040948A0|nr:hypothetical protein [Atopococcus tabaci]
MGLWLFPQESLIENGVLHHLKLLVSHGCAAAAGYQITYMFYLWRDDRKERKRVERLNKLK